MDENLVKSTSQGREDEMTRVVDLIKLTLDVQEVQMTRSRSWISSNLLFLRREDEMFTVTMLTSAVKQYVGQQR